MLVMTRFLQIGQKFESRAEMVAVGVHQSVMDGISHGQCHDSQLGTIASAVVMSGVYEDDEEVWV